jgi:hypothetical protein
MGATSEIDSQRKEQLTELLNEVLNDKYAVVKRLATELRDLEVTERHIRRKLGESLDETSRAMNRDYFLAQLELHDATDERAAAWALDRVGECLGASAIADKLIEYGYGGGRDRKQIVNSLFRAMERSPDVFAKHSEGWSLRTWRNAK